MSTDNQQLRMKKMFDELRDDAPVYPLWIMGELRAYVSASNISKQIELLEKLLEMTKLQPNKMRVIGGAELTALPVYQIKAEIKRLGK